jgi:DNA mismatch endonuclease, patch repair protein
LPGLSRSEQMARIRGKHTRPEVLLRNALWAAGLRYRLHSRTPVGRPDIVLKGRRVAVFVDGCFWHGCPRHYVRPRSRTAFWAAKLLDNFQRDHRQTLQLENEGWRVYRVWEHEIFEGLPVLVRRIVAFVRGHRRTAGLGWRVVRATELVPEQDIESWRLRDIRSPGRSKVIKRVRTTDKWSKPARNR